MAYQNPFPVPLPATFSLDKQAITLPNPRSGESAIYVHAGFPDCPTPESNPAFPKTAYECFNTGLRTVPNGNCLGRREWDPVLNDWAKSYTWENYSFVDKERTKFGSALRKVEADGILGNVAEKNWKVGVWSANRPEWQYVSQAASAYSLILVSLYDTLGPNVVSYCINHSEVRLVAASTEHIPALLKLNKECPTLKVIVSMDSFKGRFEQAGKVLKEWAAASGIQLYGWDEFTALGASNLIPHQPPMSSDIASICYTSGTTGNPKGAILTHRNLAAAAVSNLHGGAIGPETVLISYLPLSHIYERFVEDVVFAAGAQIGFSCGDNLRLLEDFGVLQPTYVVSVPRVLNRIYQAVKAGTLDAPGLKGKLLNKAFSDKLYNLHHHNTFEHAFWDRTIFKKIRMALGGKVQFIGTGSAPISPEVLDFLKVAFSCEISEGYGQTENMGTATRNVTGEHRPAGGVGPPQAGVKIKLVDVPEMGYFSTDKPYPRGEMCTTGANTTPAYYKDEVKSKETIDEDGWLHSGDIASVDEKGRFRIVDRIKNLVKLSQGEYVALEKVENTYNLCPLIAQIYIHADSLEDHVVAIVVPDPVQFAPLASKALGRTISATDTAELEKACQDPKVVKAVAQLLAPYAVKQRLNSYEKINENLALHMTQFSQENDLLTPTFKTKRNVAAKTFAKQLKALYAAAPKKAVAKL